jgi:hypothetical protein
MAVWRSHLRPVNSPHWHKSERQWEETGRTSIKTGKTFEKIAVISEKTGETFATTDRSCGMIGGPVRGLVRLLMIARTSTKTGAIS